jgi:hypothetical protein
MWRWNVRAKTLSLLGVFVLLLGAIAYGQAPGPVKAKIPFAFSAGEKALPAGQYSFTPDANLAAMQVVGADGKSSANVLIITRLAAGIHTTPADAHVVFDKIGNNYFLSEIWVPNEDGFMLRMTKEKNEHQIISVPR